MIDAVTGGAEAADADCCITEVLRLILNPRLQDFSKHFDTFIAVLLVKSSKTENVFPLRVIIEQRGSQYSDLVCWSFYHFISL